MNIAKCPGPKYKRTCLIQDFFGYIAFFFCLILKKRLGEVFQAETLIINVLFKVQTFRSMSISETLRRIRNVTAGEFCVESNRLRRKCAQTSSP